MSARTNLKIRSVIVAFVLITVAPTFAGNIIYVDADASGAIDGSSWADAFNYLQDALSDAYSGDEIHAAQGIYKPDQGTGATLGGREATFQLINGVTLKGGYAGYGEPDPNVRDIELYETILTGDLNGDDVEVNDPCDLLNDPCRADNSYHVVTGSGTDSTAILDGFTITSGNASAYNYNHKGGGMINEDGSPTVTNCRFTENFANGWGGGMCNTVYSYPTLTNCTFGRNFSREYGGGMLNFYSDPTLINCIFVGNSAGRDGGGGRGGGIHNDSGSPTLTNCVFSGNSAGYIGGGIYNESSSAPILTNCTFSGNSGVAIFTEGCTTVTNCIFWGNIDNNGTGEPAQFRFYAEYSTININYSCVQGWTGDLGGVGNMGADPLFVEPDYWDVNGVWVEGNYHLLTGSPCIDAGDPNYVPEPNETDLDGNPRVICGRIDMGAYEFRGFRLLFVDDDAAGKNDGRSWDDAYNYLQDALAACCSSDEIRVAQGIYKPDKGAGITPGDREATFQLINGVTLKGGYAGAGAPDPNARNIELYETILSGDLDGDDGVPPYSHEKHDNSYHVVTGSATDESAVFDGFTIYGGFAYDLSNEVEHGGGLLNENGSPTLKDCTFKWNSALDDGGGMYNDNSNPTLIHCTFIDNYADYGGGMYNYKSSPTLINCLFSGNEAYWQGGGMSNYQSNPTLENCTFTDNDVMDEGSGMSNTESSPTLTNCIFSGNLAGWNGGGMRNSYSSPILTNCTFVGNDAYTGGGMNNWYSTPMLANCTFSGNHADVSSGGMYNDNSSPTLTNCVFVDNFAGRVGGGMYNTESSLRLTNCIFSHNGAMYNNKSNDLILTNCTFAQNSRNALACDSYLQQYPSKLVLINCILWDGGDEIRNNDNSAITINYSDVQGGWPGDGNIDADPCFSEPGYWDVNVMPDGDTYHFWVEGDYHLLPSSPSIDAGDPNYIPEPNETDLDGKPRVMGGRIDMGAYESPIFAEARIIPRTINLASKGKSITCYIGLPEGYNVADIDPNSVLLEDEIKPEQFSVDEHKQVATAVFDREKVQSILNVGDIELTITCQLTDGTCFEATDIVQVTDKGPK